MALDQINRRASSLNIMIITIFKIKNVKFSLVHEIYILQTGELLSQN